jgi:uncharacterized protein (TIGR00255 family)
MIKSMTAYGRSSKTTSYGRWNVEIHCVNRKFLDITLHMPRELLSFDIQLRKMLSTHLQRGQVTLKVSLIQDAVSEEEVKRHVQQLQTVKDLYLSVADQLGIDRSQVLNLPFLIEQKQSVSIFDDPSKEDSYKKDLSGAVQEALATFIKMRETEGALLASEMQSILDQISNLLAQVQQIAPLSSQSYQTKLKSRIEEVKVLNPEDNDRILREVMLYAEKVDITEEIARLKSHIQQFSDLFTSSEKSVGRTMDFLVQEMNREINTICSKSDLTDLTLLAVRMKGELEKIREQSQNIE